MKLKHQLVYEPIYKHYTLLIIGSYKDTKRFLSKYDKNSGIDRRYAGYFIGDIDYKGHNTSVIWSIDKNPGTIAHEVFHLVGHIMTSVHATYDNDNDEAWAYLITYYVDLMHNL